MWTKKKLVVIEVDVDGDFKGRIVLTSDNGFKAFFGSDIDLLLSQVDDDSYKDVDCAAEDRVLKLWEALSMCYETNAEEKQWFILVDKHAIDFEGAITLYTFQEKFGSDVDGLLLSADDRYSILFSANLDDVATIQWVFKMKL